MRKKQINTVIKKAAVLGLSGVMTLSLFGCGNGAKANKDMSNVSLSFEDGRDLTIGSWWREYYASDDVIEDCVDWETAQYKDDDTEAEKKEKEVNQRACQAKFNKVGELETKYNCKFHWNNLTYDGTKESINTSILAGSPDCEIYMVDTKIAIPAQSNGLIKDLKTILPADHDLFTEQKVFTYLDTGDGKACILRVQGGLDNTFPLAFNVQMLQENNLEDPRDLYEKGEWTWDKFIEYCEVLTKDTDGDGQTDQYGYCGFANDTFAQLLMSNGAAVAAGETETLTSAATGEVATMLQDMYNKYNVCYPYDPYENGGNPSESMRFQYNNGNIAFFPISVWIQAQNGNYPADKDGQGNLTWDTAYVHWPVGPSGNKETNPMYNSADGNFFVIPASYSDEEAYRIFNFLYDLYNWYDGDISFRDDPATANWWYNETSNKEELKEWNFGIQKECLARPGIELWESLGTDMGLEQLVMNEMTPAQFQETYKQEIQDALDSVFGN